MTKPWRRSESTVAVRVLIVILLFGALSFSPRESGRKDMHTIALIDPLTSSNGNAIRNQLLRELDGSSNLTILPSIRNMHQAARDALWEFDAATQGVLILASAGRWHPRTVETLRDAVEANIPVFWLPLPDDNSPHGIGKISAPTIARAGQSIGVSVDVRLEKLTDTEIVLLANSRPVAREVVADSGTFNFVVTVPDVSRTGPLVLGAELRDGVGGKIINEIREGLLVNIAAAPSVLVVSQRPSSFAKSLLVGGWSVVEIRPSDMAGQLDRLSSVACLILDDVAATDLPSFAWNSIEKAVRHDAMGLLVLGGPNSFGLGGYRDSALESLLPVISEPPDDEAPASLIFLIDVSGSMDQTDHASSRLQIARQATIETAKALRPADRVGLMTFDVKTNELLSLDARSNHVAAIDRVWPRTASGGTILMPSLQRAVDALQKDTAEQKLLVLLTDGLLTDADLRQLDELLLTADIELVAMVVADRASAEINALAGLTQARGGRTLLVDDILRLPTLMRSEVESRRPALIVATARPTPRSPAAWLPDGDAWPEIEAYMLTRPREEAQVNLVSGRGDVLIASVSAGAGKVVAVTSGFSGWTENWLSWDRWPAFATGLTAYLAARDTRHVEISVGQDGTENAELLIELQERMLPDDLTATLVGPTGTVRPVALVPRGPGAFIASLELTEAGQFTVVVATADVTTRHRFFRQSHDYYGADEPPVARQWLDDGLIQLWDAKSLQGLEQDVDWRTRLATLALLIFLGSLILERLDREHLIQSLSQLMRRIDRSIAFSNLGGRSVRRGS